MDPVIPLFCNTDVLQLISYQLSDIEHSNLVRTCTWAHHFFVAQVFQNLTSLKSLLIKSVKILHGIDQKKAQQVAEIAQAMENPDSLRKIDAVYYQALKEFHNIDFCYKERFLLKSGFDASIFNSAKEDLLGEFLPIVTRCALNEIMVLGSQTIEIGEKYTKLLQEFNLKFPSLENSSEYSSLEYSAEYFEMLDKFLVTLKETQWMHLSGFLKVTVKIDFSFLFWRKKYRLAIQNTSQKDGTLSDAKNLLNHLRDSYDLNTAIMAMNINPDISSIATEFFKTSFIKLDESSIIKILTTTLGLNLNESRKLKLSVHNQLAMIQCAVAIIKQEQTRELLIQHVTNLLKDAQDQELTQPSLAVLIKIIFELKEDFPLQVLELFNRCSVSIKRGFIQNSTPETLFFYENSLEYLIRYLCDTRVQPEAASALIDAHEQDLKAISVVKWMTSNFKSSTAGALVMAYARKGNRSEASNNLEFVKRENQAFYSARMEEIFNEANCSSSSK